MQATITLPHKKYNLALSPFLPPWPLVVSRKGPKQKYASIRNSATAIADEQGRLGAEMVQVAELVPTEIPALKEVRGALLSLTMNEVMEAVRHLKDSRSRAEASEVTRDLESALFSMDEVIGRLEELLGQVTALLKRMEDDPEAWIEQLLELRARGETDALQAGIAAFRSAYPDHALPPELAERLP